MMSSFRSSAILTMVVVLSGCSTTSYCRNPQPYENAASIPPIKAPEGLTIATPSTALRVPEVKSESVTYGYYAPDPDNPGKERIYCLDQPPPLVIVPDAKP